MSKEETTAVRPFGMRDKVGYMFGDFGNDFTFLLASTWMLKFYTDVMGINAGLVGGLIAAARILDAFTDVTMGQIVDRSKPTKHGKFKPWIRRMCGPVALASFLIYQSAFAGMGYGFKVAWMFVTYILWGSIFYTSINIPYGSMASAVTSDAKQRTELSTWRSMGATFAGVAINVIIPLVVYDTVDGNQVLSGWKMTTIAGIFSVCAILCYLLCFNLTTERVEVPKNEEKFSLVDLLKTLFGNRALIGVILAAICMLIGQLGMSSMMTYVYPNYYGNTTAQSIAGLAGSACMLIICAPLAVRLASKFGKKELSVVSCLVGGLTFVVCLIARPASAYGFIVYTAIAYVGLGFFSFVTWAMITDVIDATEVKKGYREDGAIYSLYSWARKLGQAATSGLVGACLSAIGYTADTAFDPDVTSGIFNLACIIPAVGLLLTAVCLAFIYPLNKKTVDANVATLAARKAE